MNTNTVAVWVEMEAKPGKEGELEAFLKSAAPLVQHEPNTTAWYAVKLSDSRFAIFDTFTGDAGRQAHMKGETATTLVTKVEALFANPPQIHSLAVLAAKA